MVSPWPPLFGQKPEAVIQRPQSNECSLATIHPGRSRCRACCLFAGIARFETVEHPVNEVVRQTLLPYPRKVSRFGNAARRGGFRGSLRGPGAQRSWLSQLSEKFTGKFVLTWARTGVGKRFLIF